MNLALKKIRKTGGYRRIHDDLLDSGKNCSKHRIIRLMKENDIRPNKTWRKFKLITTDSNHSRPIYTNLINRQFDATLPTERWVSDITFRPTIEVWLYLAVIIDLFSRKIIGWSMSHRMKESLVIEALKMVLLRRKVSSKLLL